MTPRVSRLYDSADDGACRQCGECCMVLELEMISRDEAEHIGKEFCYPYHKRPGRWGIKKVKRDWAPKFADDGVCVFLYPSESGFKCMAREERPSLCSNWNCVDGFWAYTMDWKILQDRLRADIGDLSGKEKKRREDELACARKERDRAISYIDQVKARRNGVYT